MDWIEEFKQRFGEYRELKTLKADKFHGSIEINFCNGEPKNYNFKLHRQVIARNQS